MSSGQNIGKKMRSFKSSAQFDGYSKVVITVSKETEFTAGADTGRTLTLTCPWGTQEMADNILAKIQGFQYQPFTADDAIIDPAAELGDGITANNVYSGIYTNHMRFGRKLRATLSAPEGEEVLHEFPYESKSDRRITRELRGLTSELKIQSGLISAEVTDRKNDIENIEGKLSVQSDQIEAKVSKSGGDTSSFGWVLDESSWTIKSGGSNILKASKDGLEVFGKITATSGTIGGFTINSNSLSYNNQTWGGTNSSGIYLGPNGLQLGKNFKVDSSGNLTAASGTFTGSVQAGNIQYGGSAGYLSGGGISSGSITGSRIAGSTITTSHTSGGINTSLGYADFSNGVFNGYNTATLVRCSSMIFDKRTISRSSVTINGQKINYLGWV